MASGKSLAALPKAVCQARKWVGIVSASVPSQSKMNAEKSPAAVQGRTKNDSFLRSQGAGRWRGFPKKLVLLAKKKAFIPAQEKLWN
jgi:hypothetical protein